MSRLKNYRWRKDIFYIDMDIVEEITDQSLGFDDTISLDFDSRFKRKIKLVSDNGYEFFLSLDKAAELPANGTLILKSKKKIRVLAAKEALMRIETENTIDLMKAIWHIGNRHLNCDISDTTVILREDKVIAEMLEKLNCKVAYFQGCFTPLSGAYGVGRTFTHSH